MSLHPVPSNSAFCIPGQGKGVAIRLPDFKKKKDNLFEEEASQEENTFVTEGEEATEEQIREKVDSSTKIR